jgi:uncharacterized protein involved in tolerance to divalent cations
MFLGRPASPERAAVSPRTLVVLTTCATPEEAVVPARRVVERRPRRCVNTLGSAGVDVSWQGRCSMNRRVWW